MSRLNWKQKRNGSEERVLQVRLRSSPGGKPRACISERGYSNVTARIC